MTGQPAVAEAFKPFQQQFRIRESKIGCVVSLILVPAGVTLDYVVYPEMLLPFFLLRLLCDAAIAGVLLLHFTEFGQRNIRLLLFAWSLIIQVALCAMIFLTEGASSTYYAGLNLVVLAIGLVLPFSYLEAIVFSLLSLLIYWITCYLHSGTDIDYVILFNNSYFIVLTAIISIVAVYFREQQRFEEFRLNHNLEEQNKRLAEMDQYKSRFFANISHELRTPLTLILGPLDDILHSSTSLDERVATLMHTARENGLRLLKLVNDLLDLIKLESGSHNLDLRAVDINSYVTELLTSVQYMAETREITVVDELGSEPALVRADEGALERILMNLLSNSIKFTPRGGTITIRSWQQEDQVVVAVSDTGVGINQEELPFIFDRFRQADGSSTRKFTGAGIGLALAKELAESMGGSIEARSEPDQAAPEHGTTMTVYLQPATGAEETRQEANHDTDVAQDSIERLHRAANDIAALPIDEPDGLLNPAFNEADLPTVLVVDDEPAMRRYLVDILATNYRVSEARDGGQALDLARQQVPDLMVLDLMLPVIDGHQVCQLLKEDSKTKLIKIVMLTATVDEKAKLKALEYGADDFLAKPFGRTELLTRLKNLYNARQLEQDLTDKNRTLTSTLSELKQVQSSLIQSEKINAIGNLAAGLLHEVNNPLNYSLTAIQMLKYEKAVVADPDVVEMVADISEGMERIKAIVSDLRSFAYPSEAEKQSTFNFSDALSSSLRFTAADLKQITVEQHVEQPDAVIGSYSHIVQVLVNLLGNAAKALTATAPGLDASTQVSADRVSADRVSGQQSGKITIHAAPEGDRYIVTIADNGVGMSEKTLSQIFDPFFTTREVGQGMGMGLSICHTIITNHDGKLLAESAPGEGSAFTFDLQLGAASEPVMESVMGTAMKSDTKTEQH